MNKSQGQTFKAAGLGLSGKCFSLGHSYVALWRTTFKQNLFKVFNKNLAADIVYKYILQTKAVTSHFLPLFFFYIRIVRNRDGSLILNKRCMIFCKRLKLDSRYSKNFFCYFLYKTNWLWIIDNNLDINNYQFLLLLKVGVSQA